MFSRFYSNSFENELFVEINCILAINQIEYMSIIPKLMQSPNYFRIVQWNFHSVHIVRSPESLR